MRVQNLTCLLSTELTSYYNLVINWMLVNYVFLIYYVTEIVNHVVD
jgi:hypothetical protein